MQRAEEKKASAVALELGEPLESAAPALKAHLVQAPLSAEADVGADLPDTQPLAVVSAPQLDALLVKHSLHRWLAAFVGFQVALAVALLLVGLLGQRRLTALSEQVHASRQEVQALRAELSTLGGEARQLKAETVELKQFLMRDVNAQELFLKILVLRPDVDPALARKIARLVHRYSVLYGRDPDLVLSIMAIESRFDPNAVSSVGAVGLMQVMPQWQKVLAISGSLKDPETSIQYGLQVLGFYLEMYKDVEMALTAYNRGPGPVDMALMRGQDPKNEYPGQVLKVYERLKKMALDGKPT